MRVLHVTDTYLPRLGGIEVHVAELARRQQASGHDVLVLTAERLSPSGDPTSVPTVRLHGGVTGLGGSGEVRRATAGFAPDVIHAHLSVGSPFTWATLRNTQDVPTVTSVHSLLPQSPRLVRAGMQVLGLRSEHIIFTAVSHAAAVRVRAALGAGRPVPVLHNGIDPAAWTVAHEPTGEFAILCVGRLAARKRPLVLVDALAQLSESAPRLDWSATVIGDGGQRTRIAEAVQRRGLTGRVRLVGALSRGEIRRHLARADVLVAPATLESFGIAALEARCAGVPIVGMARSGITEFITDGVDGLLADSDAQIAECLLRLATDEELAAQIRVHNATAPVPMTWDAVLAQHDVVYRYAAETARSRTARVVSGALMNTRTG
jgi:glycosyltransferase involved in cell wall biosynthesis